MQTDKKIRTYVGMSNKSHDAMSIDAFNRQSFYDVMDRQFAADRVEAKVYSVSIMPQDKFRVYIEGNDQVRIQKSLCNVFSQLNIQGMVEVAKHAHSIRGEVYRTWLQDDKKVAKAMSHFGNGDESPTCDAVETSGLVAESKPQQHP